MSRRRTTPRPAILAFAALVLVVGGACGDDDVETSTGDERPADPHTTDDAPLGDGGGAASACLEGTPDCQDTPMDDDPFPTDAARDQARAYLGVPETELTPDVRIARRGSETFALTEDYVLGRTTVELDDDGSGTFVVVSATVELPEGPETFEG